MPEPIGAPSGITAAQPSAASFWHATGSSVTYGQHREALLHQDARGLDRRRHVGEQRARVADHLELHQLGREQLAAQPRGGDGILDAVTAGGVGKQREALGRDEVEQALALGRVELRAAQRDRHDLGAGRLGAGEVLLEGGVLAACR